MSESWLKRFLKLGEETEIPEMFTLWVGLCTISAVVGRNVLLDMGVYKIYPNLYVVLVAGSGRCRKSTAIGLMEKAISQLQSPPNIIAQKITPEALIGALRREGETPTGKLLSANTHEGFVIVDEFNTFLNKKSYEAGLASLLISLFDCKDEFSYHTKGRGKEQLTRTCLGILGGSTIDWLQDAIPEGAIGGGLTSRIIFVYEKIPSEPVAWTEKNPEKDFIMKSLVQDLERIRRASGTVVLTLPARELYISTYNEFCKTSNFFQNKHLAGYASRRHIHMLKIATILSLSEDNSLKIHPGHVEAATELIKDCEQSLPDVFQLITQTDVGNQLARVYSIIRNSGTISREDLMRRVSNQVNSAQLDEIIQTLAISGQVDHILRGNKQLYKAVL